MVVVYACGCMYSACVFVCVCCVCVGALSIVGLGV